MSMSTAVAIQNETFCCFCKSNYNEAIREMKRRTQSLVWMCGWSVFFVSLLHRDCIIKEIYVVEGGTSSGQWKGFKLQQKQKWDLIQKGSLGLMGEQISQGLLRTPNK